MFFRDFKIFIGASTIAMLACSGFQATLPGLAMEKQVNSGLQVNQPKESRSGLQNKWEQDINLPNTLEEQSTQVNDLPEHPLVAPRISNYLQRPTLTPVQKPLPGAAVLTQAQPTPPVAQGNAPLKASVTAHGSSPVVNGSSPSEVAQSKLAQKQKQKLARQAQQEALLKAAQARQHQQEALQKQAQERITQQNALLQQQSLAESERKAQIKQQALEKQAKENALLRQQKLAQAEEKAKAKRQDRERLAQVQAFLKQQALAQAEQLVKLKQAALEKQSQAQAILEHQRLEKQVQEKALKQQKALAQAEQIEKAKQQALIIKAQARALLKQQALAQSEEQSKARQFALEAKAKQTAIHQQQLVAREHQLQAQKAEVLTRKRQAQRLKEQEALAFKQQKLTQHAAERIVQRLVKPQAFELKAPAGKLIETIAQPAAKIASAMPAPRVPQKAPVKVAVLNKPFSTPVTLANGNAEKRFLAFAKTQNPSALKRTQFDPFGTPVGNRPSSLYIARFVVPVASKPAFVHLPSSTSVPAKAKVDAQQASVWVAPGSAQEQVDRYVDLLAHWLSADKPESLEPVLSQGQIAIAAILRQQDSLSPSALQALGQQMQGYLVRPTGAGLAMFPDAAYFAAQTHMHGTPVDVAFTDLMQQTLNDTEPSILRKTLSNQASGPNSCTRFGSHELVRLYGAWKSFQSAYPQAYALLLNDPNLPLLSNIETQLLHSHSACGSPESVQDELQAFLAGYPDSDLAPQLKKRLNHLQKKAENMQFFQGAKKR